MLAARSFTIMVIALGSSSGAQCPPPAGLSSEVAAAPWKSWGRDATNARYQPAALAGLSASNVSRLKLKWALNLGPITDARGQPTLAGGTVFVATPAGELFALDARSGCIQWRYKAEGPLHGAVAVARGDGTPAVAVFADQKANAYAVDASSGELMWRAHLDDHLTARVTGSPQVANGVAYIPVSSYEEVMALAPKYECCTFRGSVVALDLKSGRRLWKTFTIADSALPTTLAKNGVQQRGPSGAAIWSAPTIDARRGVLYVSTGNNYSDPATNTSDAVLAMDLKTGAMRWSKQLTANDAENVGCDVPGKPMCPAADGPDADFGQPPILTKLPTGRPALLIAQKSGMAYALDPNAHGDILWQTRIAKGGRLGGSQWGSATDGRQMYVAASDLKLRFVPDSGPQGYHLEPDAKVGGGLTALDLVTGKVRWASAPILTCANRKGCSPAQSAAVTVIDGVVFSGSIDGHLRAYSTATGAVLWDYDAVREFTTVNGPPGRGGSFDASGVAVSSGMVFVSSGYGLWGGTPGNVLLAFSLDGR